MQEKVLPINKIITIPSRDTTLDEFKEITKENVIDVFGLTVDKENKDYQENKLYPLNQFLENSDHGAEHVYNVYKKAVDIARQVTTETGEKIDQDLLYTMIALHDSGRFHMQMPNEETGDEASINHIKKANAIKAKKAKRADSKHELYGVAQFNFALAKLRSAGKSIDPIKIDAVRDYVYNHDFMTEQISGIGRFHEPKTIEGQIARLADRISTPAIPEIDRYRATGKRMGTTFFDPTISFEERKNFSFAKIGEYIKNKKLDQFMFFATLLAVKAKDFAHPTLQKIYADRAPQKREAAEHIVTIAQKEGFEEAIINGIKKTLKEYSEIYEFDF